MLDFTTYPKKLASQPNTAEMSIALYLRPLAYSRYQILFVIVGGYKRLCFRLGSDEK